MILPFSPAVEYPFLLMICDFAGFGSIVSVWGCGFVGFGCCGRPLLLTACDLDKFRPFVSVWGCDFVGFGRYGCALLLMTYDFAGFGLIVSG